MSVIPLYRLKSMENGHAWMELRRDPEVSPAILPEEFLQEIVWMDDDMMLRDVYGCVSTSHWHDECEDTYCIEWRVWTDKPSAEQMKKTPWATREE